MAFTLTASSLCEVTFLATNDETVAIAKDSANTRGLTQSSYSFGTGDNQINQYYRTEDELTASSGNFDFDLRALVNLLNSSIPGFSAVKELFIANVEATTGADLIVSPSPSNGWTSPFSGVSTAEIAIPPSGHLHLKSPLTGFVVNSTNRNLRLSHGGASSGAITFRMIIEGLS